MDASNKEGIEKVILKDVPEGSIVCTGTSFYKRGGKYLGGIALYPVVQIGNEWCHLNEPGRCTLNQESPVEVITDPIEIVRHVYRRGGRICDS